MDFLLQIFIGILRGALVLGLVVLPGAVISVYGDRKVSAWIQNRVGPNRTGPFGLLQPFADVLKLLFKEDIVPIEANKSFHFLAPLISVTAMVASFAVTPFGNYFMIGDTRIDLTVAPNINVALLYVLGIGSVAVYGITFAGWSSGNKYSLLGGLRSSAQMISYELCMGLSLIGVLILAGSMNLNDIVKAQADLKWNIFLQPIGFIIFLVASFAEMGRAPFDLPEAEPELVGGYHTEYSGMKFGMFFLAEYGHTIAASTMISTLFLGGWQLPVPNSLLASAGLVEGSAVLAFLQVGAFFAKAAAVLFFILWVRWTLPRFRYDQLMNLGWKILLPLALANIIVTSAIAYFFLR
jgi:NADH-quinone oxidoreductase subunit H